MTLDRLKSFVRFVVSGYGAVMTATLMLIVADYLKALYPLNIGACALVGVTVGWSWMKSIAPIMRDLFPSPTG